MRADPVSELACVGDQFIGWSKKQREANLCYLANNLRFLILPGPVPQSNRPGEGAGSSPFSSPYREDR
jgi:hypothetical protein